MASVALKKMDPMFSVRAPVKNIIITFVINLKPARQPSSNIRLGEKGHGHYVESAFEDVIYKNFVEQDWWIESEAYKKLLNDLGAVDFYGEKRRAYVPDLITRVHKDMPANPGVCFPCHRGKLGREDYAPLRFVVVGATLRSCFQRLVKIWYSNDASYDQYSSTLDSIMSATVPSYNRDKFESKFELVWIDNRSRRL